MAREMWKSEALASDAIGRLMAFWGFRRNMGRIWTVLYLSGEPLSAHDLRERLSLSSGAVSMTLRELQRWGVVTKAQVTGQRREHFVAEGKLWKMISRVLRERERQEVARATEALKAALMDLRERQRSADPRVRVEARAQAHRIGQLLELAELGAQLIDALVERGQVDARGLAKVLLGVRR